MNYIHLLILLAILVTLAGAIYYFNPYFDHTPYEQTLMIDHHTSVKGAWGKYYNLTYKGEIGLENILVERSAHGKEIMEKLLAHQYEDIPYATFRLKITSRCDVRHGCYGVIGDVLEDTTVVTK